MGEGEEGVSGRARLTVVLIVVLLALSATLGAVPQAVLELNYDYEVERIYDVKSQYLHEDNGEKYSDNKVGQNADPKNHTIEKGENESWVQDPGMSAEFTFSWLYSELYVEPKLGRELNIEGWDSDRSGWNVTLLNLTDDDHDDVVIGAPEADNGGGTTTGAVYIFFGDALESKLDSGPLDPNDANVTIYGASGGDEFGWSVADAGDWTGNGIDDLVVGAPGAGNAYVFEGSTTWSSTIDLGGGDSADVTLTGDANDEFGAAVGGGVNLTADSSIDIFVGAPAAEAGRGNVFTFEHDSQNSQTTGDSVLNITGKHEDDRFGHSLAGVSVATQTDNRTDLMVGAPYAPENESTGRAYIFYGQENPSGEWNLSQENANVTLDGEGEGDKFGWSVFSAGDVNEDGFKDVIVGAPGYNSDQGRAYVYLGGSDMGADSDTLSSEESKNIDSESIVENDGGTNESNQKEEPFKKKGGVRSKREEEVRSERNIELLTSGTKMDFGGESSQNFEDSSWTASSTVTQQDFDDTSSMYWTSSDGLYSTVEGAYSDQDLDDSTPNTQGAWVSCGAEHGGAFSAENSKGHAEVYQNFDLDNYISGDYYMSDANLKFDWKFSPYDPEFDGGAEAFTNDNSYVYFFANISADDDGDGTIESGEHYRIDGDPTNSTDDADFGKTQYGGYDPIEVFDPSEVGSNPNVTIDDDTETAVNVSGESVQLEKFMNEHATSTRLFQIQFKIYVKIYAPASTKQYFRFWVDDARMDLTHGEDPYEENDDRSSATDLSSKENLWLSSINGKAFQEDQDWYEIYVDSNEKHVDVDLIFNNSNGDIDLVLYDSGGNYVTGEYSSDDNEFLDYKVSSSGTYYLKVYNSDVVNIYDLMWSDKNFTASSWNYKKKYILNHTKIDADLTNFPFRVSLENSNFNFSCAQSDGGDLRFIDGSDSDIIYDYEIEEWQPDREKAEIWVNIPQVDASADTIFYMYYGNPSAINGFNTTSSWNSNYKSSHHLSETPSSEAHEFKGSTSFNHDGQDYDGSTEDGMETNDKSPGRINVCPDFGDGVNDRGEHIEIPGTDYLIMNGTDTVTVSAWVRPDRVDIGEQFIASHYDWGSSGYSLEIVGSHFLWKIEGESGRKELQTNNIIKPEYWYHVAAVANKQTGKLKIYVNGTLEASDTNAPQDILPRDGPLKIGMGGDTTSSSYGFDGQIDEVRVSDCARSSAWIKASYLSQRDDLPRSDNLQAYDDGLWSGPNGRAWSNLNNWHDGTEPTNWTDAEITKKRPDYPRVKNDQNFVLLKEDFEDGLDSDWSLYGDPGQHGNDKHGNNTRTFINAHTGDASWAMNTNDSNNYNLNEITVSFDPHRYDSVTLDFFYTNYGENDHDMPDSWSGHTDADGVAISNDGSNWYELWNYTPVSTQGDWENVHNSNSEISDPDSDGTDEISLSETVYLRFQQYDNHPIPDDGILWDDIYINATTSQDENCKNLDVNSGGSLEVDSNELKVASKGEVWGQINMDGGFLKCNNAGTELETGLHVYSGGLLDQDGGSVNIYGKGELIYEDDFEDYWHEDFRDGNVDKWTVNNLSADPDQAYEGSYSGYCSNARSDTYQAYSTPFPEGKRPINFKYYWRETSSSYGGGIRIFNSDGNVELGVATDNPALDIDDGNGIEDTAFSDDYLDWKLINITFHWSSGTFDIYAKDMSDGDTYSDTGRPLKEGTDLAKIQIDDYTANNWQDGSSIDMWFDDFSVSNWTASNTEIYSNPTNRTSSSGSYSLQIGETEGYVTSKTIDLSSYSSPTLNAWIRRGHDDFSEDPDSSPDEDLEVQYYDEYGNWDTLETFAGDGTPGQIYNRSYLLPSDACHSGFKIRFHQTGGSGDTFDYWHIDDISVSHYPSGSEFYSNGEHFTDLKIEGSFEVAGADSETIVQDDIKVINGGTIKQGNGIIATHHQADANVYFDSASSEEITGGTIRCSHNFTSEGNFNPNGGQVNVTDTDISNPGSHASNVYTDNISLMEGDAFYDLNIIQYGKPATLDSDVNVTKEVHIFDRWSGSRSYFEMDGYHLKANELHIGDNDTIEGNGQINMTSSDAQIYVKGENNPGSVQDSIEFEKGGYEDISAGKIYCGEDFTMWDGSEFSPTGGTVIFNGTKDGYIVNKSASSHFYNLNISKSGAWIRDRGDGWVKNWLEVTGGTFELDSDEYTVEGTSSNPSTIIESGGDFKVTGGYFDMPDGGDDVEIKSNGRMYTSAGMVNITDDLDVYGTLDIDGGKVQNSYNSGGYGKFYFYDGSSGTMTGGTLRVFDWIEWKTDTTWTMTGGTLLMSGDNALVDVKMTDPSVELYHFEVDDYGSGVTAESESSTYPFDINGDVTIQSGGTWDANGDNMDVAGDWTNSGSFIPDKNNVTFDGSQTAVIAPGGISDTKDFYNITIDSTAKKSLTGQIDIDGRFNISSGTFDAAGNDMYVEGDWENDNGGSFISGSNTVYFDDGSAYIYTGGIGDYNDFNNVEVGASGNTKTLEGDAIDIDGYFNITAGTFQASGNNMEVAGDWDNANGGTFISGSNTVYLDGSQSSTVYTGGTGTVKDFNNLHVDSSSYTKTLSGDPINITGDFKITDGTFNADGNDMYVAGKWDNDQGGIFNSGSNTVYLNGGSATVYPGGIGTDKNFNNLEVDTTGTKTLSGNAIDIDGYFNITADSTFDSGGEDMYVEGNWENDNGGEFISGLNTVYFDDGSAYIYTGGTGNKKDFNNVTVNASGNTKWLSDNAIDIDGYFNITAGTFDTGGEDMYVAGDWKNDNGGSFTSGTNTVHFDGGGATIYTGGPGNEKDFHNLNVTASGAKTLSGYTMDIDGYFNITAGTFTPNGYDMTVEGNWNDSDGTFQADGGKVTMDGGSSTITTDSTNNFHDLFINSGGTISIDSSQVSIHHELEVTSGTFRVEEGETVDFSGDTATSPIVDVNGTLELDGTSSSSSADIISDSDSRMNWTVSGTLDANNYTIKYPDGDGVNILSGATILSLENGTYDNPADDGVLLNLSGVGSNIPTPIYNCSFNNTGGFNNVKNVRANIETKKVQFRHYYGDLALTPATADQYEDDPDDKIYWGVVVSVKTKGGYLNSDNYTDLYWQDTGVEYSRDVFYDGMVVTKWMDYDSSFNVSTPIDGPGGVKYVCDDNVSDVRGDVYEYTHFFLFHAEFDPDITIDGPEAGAQFGWSVSGAADFDDSGHTDIAIGAPGWNESQGRAYYFYTGGKWEQSDHYVPEDADVVRTGENTGDRFGHGLSGPGDVLKVDRQSVLVSAPYFDSDSGSNHGRTYLFELGEWPKVELEFENEKENDTFAKHSFKTSRGGKWYNLNIDLYYPEVTLAEGDKVNLTIAVGTDTHGYSEIDVIYDSEEYNSHYEMGGEGDEEVPMALTLTVKSYRNGEPNEEWTPTYGPGDTVDVKANVTATEGGMDTIQRADYRLMSAEGEILTDWTNMSDPEDSGDDWKLFNVTVDIPAGVEEGLYKVVVRAVDDAGTTDEVYGETNNRMVWIKVVDNT